MLDCAYQKFEIQNLFYIYKINY